MMRGYLILAAVLAFGLPGTVTADPLAIGSPAPPLLVETWVKGDPVNGIEKGKVYVIEFWGTACAPCIKCMPHLTEVQRKHPDVIFVALSDEPERDIRDFVAKHDKDMGFRVAHDGKARMWKAWMKAADLQGIPTAFIVDGAGRVAWFGQAAKLDEPLRQILAGTFDPQLDVFRLRLQAAEKKQKRVENDRLDRYNAVVAVVEKRIEQGKWDAALTAVEEASRDPRVDQQNLQSLKVYVLACNPAKADEAMQFAVVVAAEMRSKGGYDSASHSRSYFHLASSLRGESDSFRDPRHADLAIALLEWATDDLPSITSLENRLVFEYEIHQLQASGHACRKRFEKAISHQESALALLPRINPQNRINGWRPIEEGKLKATLAEYTKGLTGTAR
jgi:thiol-disulfide isomerase/thioredoxin